MQNFAKTVGVNEKSLNTSIMFIQNAGMIDPNDQRSITCLAHHYPIIVIEIDGINNG